MSASDENSVHEYWMQKALQQARMAEHLGEVPIGAVVVFDGKLIGAGYNRREIDQNPLGHAELAAIRQASQYLGGWRLAGCALYVTLEPCPMCAGAIVQARIGRVCFGAFDPKSGYAGSLHNTLRDQRLNHQVEITSGVCQAECSRLLQSFFRRLRSKGSSTTSEQS